MRLLKDDARRMSGSDFRHLTSDIFNSPMDLHAALTRIAPEVVSRMVFLTGGIFTAAARTFVERTSAPIVEKPFDPASLREMVAKRVGGG